MSGLRPGAVLAYSAGSSRGGPDGYRVARAGDVLAFCLTRWPWLAELLAPGPPLVVNAYPAPTGPMPRAILVDTYLSLRTASRALQLAHREGLPVILLAQPLFAAEFLFRHAAVDLPLPTSMVLAVGGYPLPWSLERALETLLASRGIRVHTIHLYGVAEVDAACLVAAERDDAGRPIYQARPDVSVDVAGGRMLLSLRDELGATTVERFETGDLARRVGDAWEIACDPGRVDPRVLAELEGWSFEDWERRTGFLGSTSSPAIMLREGVDPRDASELRAFDFAARHGFSWLEKPRWGPCARASAR